MHFRPVCTRPPRVEEALTVGASDQADARARFSNYGARPDLFAPGAAITSASSLSDTCTATLSGTSMASPHVAGAAAVYLAGHRKASPARVGRALGRQAAAGKVTRAGPGSPNRLPQVNYP